MIFKKIGIYRKCDKKAKTVYWEKRLRKEERAGFNCKIYGELTSAY